MRALGDGVAIVGERAMRDGAADSLYERIVFAEGVHVYNKSEPKLEERPGGPAVWPFTTQGATTESSPSPA
jgi:hypothetical protein